MQHESKKIALIVNELVTMLLLNSNGNIEVDIKRSDEATEIAIIQHQCSYDEDFIQMLRYSLNVQRQTEVEGYYWQLVGDDDDCDELSLVGTMIDQAVVELKGQDLWIDIIRKKE